MPRSLVAPHICTYIYIYIYNIIYIYIYIYILGSCELILNHCAVCGLQDYGLAGANVADWSVQTLGSSFVCGSWTTL